MKMRVSLSLLTLSLAIGLTGCRTYTSVSYGGYYGRDCAWGGYYDYCDAWGCYPSAYCRRWAPQDSTNEVATSSHKSWTDALGLKPAAVKRIDRAIDLGLKNNPQGYFQLGLSQKDMERLGRGELPTSQGLTKVARELSITPAKSRELFLFLMDGVRQQAKDEGSRLWKACLDSGQWQTPENNNCSKTYWNGCSPKTGASMCVPSSI